ncbi:MAG: phage portal protein [Oscillospiraceae bacterium]|nr:phage portal protein [Oscillospiraceae bacterium]
MSIISRLRERRRKQIIAKVLVSPDRTPSRLRVGPTWIPHWLRGDYTLRNSELIFAAVSRISNAFSAMPVQLYRGASPVRNDLNDMVSFAPNPYMTSCTFFKTLEACRGTAGDCYALKVFFPGESTFRLDVLDPTKVRPIIEKESKELWWRITPDEGPEFLVHDYYMVHVPFISTNGIGGISPVSVLFDTLRYSENIQEFSAKQLEQGVNSAIVLEAPANLGAEQKKQMIEDFMETYRETSGNILLLESGVTAKVMNLSPVDSKLFEVEKITRSKVAMVYNLPPHLLGDYSDTSFTSQEQQMLEFLMLTMLPIVTAYEQELDRKLLTAEQRKRGYHFKFNMESILRADAATQAEVDYKAVRSAWKTPDEIRASRNMPALPGGIGKHAMISQDLATLDYTVNEKPKVMANGKREPVALPPKEEEPPDE